MAQLEYPKMALGGMLGWFPLAVARGAYTACCQGPRRPNLAHGGGGFWATPPVAGGRLPWRGGGCYLQGTKGFSRMACRASVADQREGSGFLRVAVQLRKLWELGRCRLAPKAASAEKGGCSL